MIYLDHNATTFPLVEVKNFVNANLTLPFNASSVHTFGRNARKLLEESREKIANTLGIKLGRGEYKIIFTSGGTEANNLVINNYKDNGVLFSSIEHPSTIEPAKNTPSSVMLKTGNDGIIDLDFLKHTLENLAHEKTLISVMMANNETGIIQPIKKIVDIAKIYNIPVHTDAVQAFGKVKVNIKELDIDYMSISSHKIGGIFGVGALVVRDVYAIRPNMLGGGQEKSERSGTENVMGAACFSIAAEIGQKKMDEYNVKTKLLRDYIEKEVNGTNFGKTIFGRGERLPNTLLVASNKINSSSQLIQFDLAGIAVSNGSACSSGKVKSSHVMAAMGYGEDIASKVIRVSLGINNTLEEVMKFVEVWKQMHEKTINIKVS